MHRYIYILHIRSLSRYIYLYIVCGGGGECEREYGHIGQAGGFSVEVMTQQQCSTLKGLFTEIALRWYVIR